MFRMNIVLGGLFYEENVAGAAGEACVLTRNLGMK